MMKVEKNALHESITAQTKEKIEKRIKENVDLDFSSGRKLYRDALNFWLAGIHALELIPHYIQGYKEKGEDDVSLLKKDPENEAAKFHKLYYPLALERVIELSDPEQIKKYDELVDEFNNDLERIKKENDTECLKNFKDRAIALVDERK